MVDGWIVGMDGKREGPSFSFSFPFPQPSSLGFSVEGGGRGE